MRVAIALATAFLPYLFTRHPRDSRAIVLRAGRDASLSSDAGCWAAKWAAHQAHHRFGGFGRQPHLQLNLWRVGVKGSGQSYRVPLLSPRIVFALIAQGAA